MDHQSYDPISRYPPSKLLNMIPGCVTFRLLELILSPAHSPPSFLRDALLVSIDLGYRLSEDGKKIITQIGVATIDTKLLPSIDIDSPQSLQAAIHGRYFNLCPKRGSKKKWTPKFFWGEPENIEYDEIHAKIKEILHDSRDTPDIPSRNIVLIGHGIRSDRHILIETIGYDIKYVPSVKAILDTGRMICSAYDFGIASQSHFPLRFVLRYLGIRYDHLHNAGNDAMFTMKALVLMFTNWKHQKGQYLWNIIDEAMSSPSNSFVSRDSVNENLLWEAQIELLTAIAREPWPVRKSATYHRMTREQSIEASWTKVPDMPNLELDSFFEVMD